MLHISINTCLGRIYTDFNSKVDTSEYGSVRYCPVNEGLKTCLLTGTSSLMFLTAVARIVRRSGYSTGTTTFVYGC